MNHIEFIPLIEFATKKDEASKIVPIGTSLNNSMEWDLYQQEELKKNYLNPPQPISSGIYQYRLFDIEICDLEKAIHLHIEDTEIKDSCSLFGGYAISVDGDIELYPQCCGFLGEVQQWKKILNENFDRFYLMECHPSPLITLKEDKIFIYCKDEFDSFFPSTMKEVIELDYRETKAAFLKLLYDLKTFSTKLNTLSSKFMVDNLSNKLIWGESEDNQSTLPNCKLV